VELTLGIETSSSTYEVALFSTQEMVASNAVRRTDPAFVSIGELVAECLRSTGRTFRDIGRISVDLGPGNLGSVRAGVAYANGLSFSLGVPVIGINSLRLLAITIAPSPESTVLCIRTSASGHVYAALFEPDGSAVYRHGPHEETVRSLTAGRQAIVLAGTLIKATRNFLDSGNVLDSGVEAPTVASQRSAIAKNHHISATPAQPINETSNLFDATRDPHK
jgi:tRNA threonylcarbamoyladenosine biosynthesis protein TsaB